MDYHGITSVGKIYVQRVSTLPSWTLLDIARILYTNDTYKFHLGGSEAFREIVDCLTEQTIDGTKTFVLPPMLSRDPSAGDEAVRLSYLEDNYMPLVTYDLSGYVTLTGDQTITGLKVFSVSLPQSDVVPVNNDDLTNKTYVDTVAPKVLVSSLDSTLGYLWDKLEGGDGIALSKMGADGADQTVRISVASLAGGNFYSDLPVGTIIKYAGSSAPAGYLECDGAAVSRTTYDELFNVIGEDYGIGNGTTTFNVPTCSGDACGGEMWCIKYAESEAVNGVDEKVKVSSDDTTAGYLEQKIIAGAGIAVTTNNPGANETFTISSAAGASSSGMWLSSNGGNNCTVHAGSIVINNVIYSLSTDQSLTISGYLRDGEVVNSAAILYLYAVGVSGSVPTFKFSGYQPTKNKYGNTVSYTNELGISELYHPLEGLTWRFLGTVKHLGGTTPNIVAFTKHYPGYWESIMIVNPFTFALDTYTSSVRVIQSGSSFIYDHGFGDLAKEWTCLWQKNSSGDNYWIKLEDILYYESGPYQEIYSLPDGTGTGSNYYYSISPANCVMNPSDTLFAIYTAPYVVGHGNIYTITPIYTAFNSGFGTGFNKGYIKFILKNR